MEKRFANEFNSLDLDELNKFNQKECNEVLIENENSKLYCAENNNLFQKIPKESKEKRKKLNFKLLISHFVALCAMAAIIQTAIPIPIFSSLFNPIASPSAEVPPKYTISSASATSSRISYSITIDNVKDFKENEYSVMLLELGNDNDEYIASIPKSIKDKHKKIVSTAEVKGSFDKFVSVAGEKYLKTESNYMLVLLKDEKIEKKQDLRTKSYVSKLIFEGVDDSIPVGSEGHYVYTWLDTDDGIEYRSLHVKVYIDDDFENYNHLYIQLINISGATITTDFTTFDSAGVNGRSSFAPRFRKDAPQQQLTFKVYCFPNDLSKLDYAETFSPDGVTTYYLIYSHPDVIIF